MNIVGQLNNVEVPNCPPNTMGIVHLRFVDENGNVINIDYDLSGKPGTPKLFCIPSNHTYKVFVRDFVQCDAPGGTTYDLRIDLFSKFIIFDGQDLHIESRPEVFSNIPNGIFTLDKDCKTTWIQEPKIK